MVEILKANEGQVVDTQELFCRATLDSIGGTLQRSLHARLCVVVLQLKILIPVRL